MKRNKEGASLEKNLERGCFFKEKKGREGVLGKSALFFFLGTVDRTGRGAVAPAAPWAPATWAMAAAGTWGKTERRERGVDSSPHLGLGRSEKADPWRLAEVGGGAWGGGAAGLGRRRAQSGS